MSARDGGPVGRREVAYRLFAAEYDDADLEYSDSDEERAPNYVVTPTGARVNRLFVVGVLTEVEPVSDDVLRARVVDPTGAFVVYAGQYQPDAAAFLDGADVPSYVAVTGKARTFQPEGSDRVFTSVRPESITAVDGPTRDRWTVQAAEHTLARIATMAQALDREERGDELNQRLQSDGIDPGFAAGIALAIDHYGTTKAYLTALREEAVAAVEVVAGERESVPPLETAPHDDGSVAPDLTAAPAVAGAHVAGEAEVTVEPAEPRPEEPEPVAVEAEESGAAPADEPEREPEPSGPEPVPETAETEPEPAAMEAEELGDFEPPDLAEDTEAGEAYDLDEAEREQVEAEFGTEFSPGTEVGAPGEAGIDQAAEPPSTEASPDAEEPAPDEEQPAGEEAADAEGPVDLEDAAVETMAALDDGDGADRDAVVEAVVEAHGADPEEVDAAIQEALMSGRCYEPADGRLKAI